MPNSRINAALQQAFDRYRIVFWDDKNQEQLADFEELTLPDVTKIKLNNNEFSVKYRVLVTEKDNKFLIYRPGGEPEHSQNWLLDVQLASYQFSAEQSTLHSTELGLDPARFKDFIARYKFFFDKKELRAKLSTALTGHAQQEDEKSLTLKIMGLMSPLKRAEAGFETILQELLKDDLANLKSGAHPLLPFDSPELNEELRLQLTARYGYQSDSSAPIAAENLLHDFVLKLFLYAFNQQTGEDAEDLQSAKLNHDALLFLEQWQDSSTYGKNFRDWSAQAAEELKLTSKLESLNFARLKELDYFREVDELILGKLRDDITHDLISAVEVSRIVALRSAKTWWRQYENYYKTAEAAACFKALLQSLSLSLDTLEEGVRKYHEHWYEVDLQYRKFNFYCRADKLSDLFSDLKDTIDNLYTNRFLRPLAQCFAEALERDKQWGHFGPITYQPDFFTRYVLPYVRKNNKVTVIISDALRYELGAELISLINQENRFSATLEPMVSSLPSFTQLGMAALLPHKSLELREDNTVYVDGLSSAGLENRRKILTAYETCKCYCVKATEVLKPQFKNKEVKELIASCDVLYVYHDIIDNAGEKDEEHLFEKSQDCLEELRELVTKLSSGNANNLIITSDHGFIYQDLRADPDPDLLDEPFVTGRKVQIDRRFLTAHGELDPSERSYHDFTSQDLGLTGDLSILIPKAIQRIRRQGQNGHYLHGGATLQETVIPVIHVNKKRKDDLKTVSVKVISQERTITAGQITLTFYQVMPVEDKVRGLTLRAGFYRDKQLVSNQEVLEFNRSAAAVAEREVKCQFTFPSGLGSGSVTLRLESKAEHSEVFVDYDHLEFNLRQNFFDRDF